MHLFNLALLGLASLVTVRADQAEVLNNCNSPIYLWSIQGDEVGDTQVAGPGGGNYSEEYRGSAISILLSGDASKATLYDGSPLVRFQYWLGETNVRYTLATSNGNLLTGVKVVLAPSDETCSSVVWPKGNGTSPVYSCGNDTNLTLTLCAT